MREGRLAGSLWPDFKHKINVLLSLRTVATTLIVMALNGLLSSH